MEKYGILLKERIVNRVKNNKYCFNDELSLIRCIYNEFNIHINYDYTWLYDKKFNMEENFDSESCFNVLTCNKISCNEWCQLFKELLLCFNINNKNIFINCEKDHHKWVEIKIGNHILIADGTTNYHGCQDIYNCKVKEDTTGFIIINDNKRYSLEKRYKENLLTDDEIIRQSKEFDIIDNNLIFHGNPLFGKMKKIIESDSSDEIVFLKLLKLLCNYKSEFVLNGSDLSRYLRKNLQGRKIVIEFLAYFLDNYIETACKIKNRNKIIFYSENTKVLLNEEYNKFESNIRYVKKNAHNN